MDQRTAATACADLRGHRVLSLPATNSLNFLEAVFACWHEGRLFSVTRDPAALQNLGLQIEEMVPGTAGKTGWGRFDHIPRHSDAPAQIVFSSGTEGQPKAILISHRNLADVVERLNAVMEVTNEIREYIGVPVTYSFGLGRARAVAAAGGAFFLPQRFDPVEIRDMLEAGEINAISAVPSLWRTVLTNPDVIGKAGEKVRWIEIGSQYMSAADKMAMRDLFPHARIVQHYGLTEASRTSFLNIPATPEAALESVGVATGRVELRIADDDAIAIRGDHVALGQVQENGQVMPLTDADGWLLTKDRGCLRDGRLYYLGRLDDQINLAGIKMGAEGLEAEIRTLVPSAGEQFAIAPIPDDARGEAVLLAIEAPAADRAPLIEAAAGMALSRRGVAVGQGRHSALKVLTLENLPRTGTNKIQRRLLPDIWAARAPDMQATADIAPSAALSEDEARLAAIWARVVGDMPFTPETSFYDAGGDSLSSVQIGLVMEAEGLPRAVVRATLEGRGLHEAAALMTGQTPPQQVPAGLPDAARRSWAITMTRAIMALSVLLSHWGPGLFGRLGLSERAESALVLIYRMGTPGFAAVFGIGIGYFMLPGFGDKRVSVLRRLRSSFHLVLLGLVLLAAIKLVNVAALGDPVNGLAVAHAFYGVLAYYAIMLGTARWWLPALARLEQPVPWLLVAFVGLWLVWQAVPHLLPSRQLQSVLEWPRLMLMANYNLFKLTAVAAVGMAAGYWLSRQRDSAAAAQALIVAGGVGMVAALLTLIEAHGFIAFQDRENPVFVSLPGLVFYISSAVFGVGLFLRLLLGWERLAAPLRIGLQILVVIGGLALPIYVFHWLVIPARDLLAIAGLPGVVALVISLGGFLATMAYAGHRLWRMYFS